MQEQSRYAVGIDVGTTNIRCVVSHIDPATGSPTIIGVGKAKNSGMRKGTVVNLNGPASAIDTALADAERMSGYEVNEATISVNGSHIISTKTEGMIAVGTANHEIDEEDVDRIMEVAVTGKIPANRRDLEVIAFNYILDGQDGIKDPIGMSGTRLEVKANVISAMVPHMTNLEKSVELASVKPNSIVPSVMASAKAVLSESQLENGVAVIDMGGSTTSVAVFEEGDLQYIGIIPMGGMNITNDLAIGLKTDPEIAEKIKLQHASLMNNSSDGEVSVKVGKDTLIFNQGDIEEITEARLEEIFELVNSELKKAGRAGKLPSGVVLVGGTSNIKGILEFAKKQLGVAARLGKPKGFGGVADGIDKPEFATAVGLMLIDAENVIKLPKSKIKFGKKSNHATKIAGGFLSSLFNRMGR